MCKSKIVHLKVCERRVKKQACAVLRPRPSNRIMKIEMFAGGGLHLRGVLLLLFYTVLLYLFYLAAGGEATFVRVGVKTGFIAPWLPSRMRTVALMGYRADPPSQKGHLFYLHFHSEGRGRSSLCRLHNWMSDEQELSRTGPGSLHALHMDLFWK